METVVVNLTGRARRQRFDGREFLVAPATMLVPGVLNGSQGPLLYELPDIQSTANAWNNMPILLNHPVGPTGRSPEVIDKVGLGSVFNATVNGKLLAEAWLDIGKCNLVDNRIIPAVESGGKVELSTGVVVDAEDKSGVHNGENYIGIARNHRPDHLAILLDQKGACSIQDGCGVNNKDPLTTKETKMAKLSDKERSALVDDIVNNCSCWQEEDRTALNELGDKYLSSYVTTLENAATKEDKTALEFATKVEKYGDQESVLNALEDLKKFQKKKGKTGDEEEEEEEEEVVEGKASSKNKGKKIAKNEIQLEDLPAELQEDITFARNAKQQRKDQLIAQLVSNREEKEQAARAEHLNTLSLNELEDRIADLPKVSAKSSRQPEAPVYNYLGINAPAPAAVKEFKPDPLSQPVWNFDPVSNS